MQDLLDVNDPDWQAFTSKDPEFFLRVAGTAIRTFCGWHLSPSLSVTEAQQEIGARGIIMLPSRYVTAVDSVVLFPGTENPWTLNPDTDYLWYRGGWIEQSSSPLWGWNYQGAYYYGPDGSSFPPVYQAGVASVTFTHGYETLPDDIKEVAYELAQASLVQASGNVKELSSPGFRLSLAQPFGMSLNGDQKRRLANYRIGGTK